MSTWTFNRSFTTAKCNKCGNIIAVNPVSVRGLPFDMECLVCKERRLEREKKEFIDKSEGFIEVPTPKVSKHSSKKQSTKSIKTETGE